MEKNILIVTENTGNAIKKLMSIDDDFEEYIRSGRVHVVSPMTLIKNPSTKLSSYCGELPITDIWVDSAIHISRSPLSTIAKAYNNPYTTKKRKEYHTSVNIHMFTSLKNTSDTVELDRSQSIEEKLAVLLLITFVINSFYDGVKLQIKAPGKGAHELSVRDFTIDNNSPSRDIVINK